MRQLKKKHFLLGALAAVCLVWLIQSQKKEGAK